MNETWRGFKALESALEGGKELEAGRKLLMTATLGFREEGRGKADA